MMSTLDVITLTRFFQYATINHQATINEVLRISCTAPGSLMHVAMEDIHVNGYTLPKVIIIVIIIAIIIVIIIVIVIVIVIVIIIISISLSLTSSTMWTYLLDWNHLI